MLEQLLLLNYVQVSKNKKKWKLTLLSKPHHNYLPVTIFKRFIKQQSAQKKTSKDFSHFWLMYDILGPLRDLLSLQVIISTLQLLSDQFQLNLKIYILHFLNLLNFKQLATELLRKISAKWVWQTNYACTLKTYFSKV